MIKKAICSIALLAATTACSAQQAKILQHRIQAKAGHTALCTATNPYAPCISNGDNEPIVPTPPAHTYIMDEAGKVPQGCCNQPDILDVRLEPLDPQTDSPQARCDNMGGILQKGSSYDICHDVDY